MGVLTLDQRYVFSLCVDLVVQRKAFSLMWGGEVPPTVVNL